MLKIAQITDLHIGQEGEDTYGVDVRQNFLSILAAVKSHQPDYLVVSGDLCYRDGETGIYHWIKNHLDNSGLPYELLSGNHDDPTMLADVFSREADLEDGELFYTRNWKDHSVIFLDTTPGTVSDQQLEWLEAQLAKQSGTALIFMHHPPLLAGLQFMDQRHPLQNRKAVQKVLEKHPHPIHIFTGHYHSEKSIQQQNYSVHITPACFFQISPFSSDFEVDHYRIGYRWIEWNGVQLRHSVRYL